MALKVKLASGMRQIDTTIHRPVTFVGGQKKVLSKGVTFVNGVKKILWGDEGVPTDFIAVDGVGCGKMFCIGETWMHTSNGNVYTFDISNLSIPSLSRTVEWGTVFEHSGYQSTGTGMVFGTTKNTTGNKLVVASDGGITIPTSIALASGVYYARGMTNTEICQTKILSKSFTVQQITGRIVTYRYGNDYYWGGIKKYSTGTAPATSGGAYTMEIIVGDLNTTPQPVPSQLTTRGDYCGIQNSSSSILLNIQSTTHTNLNGLYSATNTVLTKVREQLFGLKLLDGNYYCGYGSTMDIFCLYNKSSFVAEYTYTDAGWKFNFLGRIGNYYYLVATKDGNAKLVVLSKTDLSFVWEQPLENDPFGENDTTFWTNIDCYPHVSLSGFLGACVYTASKLRVVRIGQLLY